MRIRSLLLGASFIGSVCNLGAVIVGWGENNLGQVTIPVSLSNVTALATGTGHSLAVKSDGTVVGWGSNISGETIIPAGLSNVIAVAAGGDGEGYGAWSLALKSDGTVYGWGDSRYGQACGVMISGAPYTTNGLVQLGGQALSDVVAIAANDYDSFAVRSDGTVVAWGADYYFPYGFPTILSDLTNIVSIAGSVSAGLGGFIALKLDGTVVATRMDFASGPVPAGLSNVMSIATAYNHCLALQSNGVVVAWGKNDSGQINVPAGLSNVTAIAAGGSWRGTDAVSLALKTDGNVIQWGGTNATPVFYNDVTVPQPAGLVSVTAIRAAGGHALVMGPSLAYGPRIFTPPHDTNANLGGTAAFSVIADGTDPISYQWLFNGAPIAGATNSTLILPNVPLAAAGNYSVIASTPLGHVTSDSAKLGVNPANDLFANRQAIPGGGGRILSSTAGAGKEPGEPYHAGNVGGASVWYSWQAPSSGAVTIDTIGSLFDTLLAVYTGTNVAALTVIAADDDGANFNGNSKLSFVAMAGTSYMIAVDGYYHTFPYSYPEFGALVLKVTPGLSLSGILRTEAGQVRFTVAGPGQTKVSIQASSDLRSWSPLGTIVIPDNGTFLFADGLASGQPRRFYRALFQ